jgi:hypothetical protein
MEALGYFVGGKRSFREIVWQKAGFWICEFELSGISHREGFKQIQVFCFRFDNCNNTMLVYAYILM